MLKKKSLSEKINSAKNISIRDYMLNYSHSGITTFAAGILVILCSFPILYNVFYNIYDAIEYPEKKVTMGQVIFYNHYWLYILIFLSVIMCFLLVYQIMLLHYKTGLRNIFRWAWIKDRWLPFCLMLLLFWSILSASFSSNPMLGFLGDDYRKDGVVTFFVFAFIFVTSFLPNEKQIKTICEVLVFTGVITGFMVALGIEKSSLLFFHTKSIHNAIFANSNHYGYFLSICYPLLVGLIMQDKSKNVLLTLFRVGEFWLITNAIMIANGRGCFLSIIIAMIGWNIYVLAKYRQKWYKILLIDAMFLFIIFFLNTNNALLKRVASIGPSIQHAIDSGTQDAIEKVGSSRLVLWKLGIESSFEHPIFGYGPDNLYLETTYEISKKPHNEFIEIAASLGYPALIFYLAGIIGQGVLFLKDIKRVSMLEVIVFSSACCYLVSSFFGNVMFYTAPYYYLMLGFSYILHRRLPKEEQVPKEEIIDTKADLLDMESVVVTDR